MRADFVSWVTGPKSPSKTEQVGVRATDLGIMWDGGDGAGRIAFGDTYGDGWGGYGAGPKTADWRKNVLCKMSLEPPRSGLHLYDWHGLKPDKAEQFLPSSHLPRRWETTIIPTAGICFEGMNYVHAMSVMYWGKPGEWTTNHSALWVEESNGWKPLGVKWKNPWSWNRWSYNGAKFQQAALVQHGDHVLMYGTPSGRQGDGFLARSLDMQHWSYWNGRGWISDPYPAVPVIPGPVAELSVIYHEPSAKWLAVTFDEIRGSIVLKSAPTPTGPWTRGEPILTHREMPELYGGFIHPASSKGDRWITVSTWGEYNVALYHLGVSDVL